MLILLAILSFFVDLCLLRRPPQALPYSPPVLALALLALLVSNLIQALASGERWAASAGYGLLDLSLMLIVVYALLRFAGRTRRFVQTATATAGASALLGLLLLVPLNLALTATDGSVRMTVAGALVVALAFWSLLVQGHIFRHSLEISLPSGVLIALLYRMLAVAVTLELAPVAG